MALSDVYGRVTIRFSICLFCKSAANFKTNLGVAAKSLILHIRLAAWRSGNASDQIKEVTLRRAHLVFGWVTVSRASKPFR